MRGGMSPKDAADDALKRIAKYYPDYGGAVIAIHKDGRYGEEAFCLSFISRFPIFLKLGEKPLL